MDRFKKLRKVIYEIDENMKEKFPSKSTTTDLMDEIDYCQKLINVIENEETIAQFPKVKEKLNILKETLEDDIEHLKISQDADAKVGHKSVDTPFFGYKTHITMTEERIITTATVTTGERNAGKELQTLVDKSIKAGITVENIIGDSAYSEKGNIEYSSENDMKLIAKLNPSVTIKSDIHLEQMSFQESNYFKEKSKERYKRTI